MRLLEEEIFKIKTMMNLPTQKKVILESNNIFGGVGCSYDKTKGNDLGDVTEIPTNGIAKFSGNIGGKEVEIKSSERNTITTILQTSFYKDDANKFYLFASNSKSPNLDIRIVSSQLLYRLSLGDDIADELTTSKQSKKLTDQITNGLATLDFPAMIQTSLATGESLETTKTFKVGRNVKIRFLISISS